jgi:hypothetical protein
MEIETALKNYLLAQTSVKAKVDQRINYVFEKNQSITKPYIVITRLVDPGIHTSDGPVAVGSIRVMVSCFGTTWTSAQDVAAAVKAALDGVTGVIGTSGALTGVTVNPVFYDDQSAGYESDTELYYIDQEYICETEG